MASPGVLGFPKQELDLSSRLVANSSRPLGDIEWHKCPDIDNKRVECGSVIVPLNYFNLSDGIATIALTKYKADASLRRGSVFTNPGGPGAPGKLVVTLLGESLATTKIGPYYDIVAFDPRGVGDTIPKVQCFESRASRDQFYRNTVFELGYTQPPKATTDPGAFYDIVAQQRQGLALFETQAKLCEKNMPNSGNMMKYMGTSSVARDIDFMATAIEGPDVPINFWAQSYGSILGMYLFNMFPHRIGRGMIEAIASPVVYVTQPSHRWMDNWIQDADKTYSWFLDSCIKAGEARCVISEGFKSPKALRNHIESFIDQVYTKPIASPNSTVPAFLTAGAVRTSIYNALLFPATWSDLASRLKSAMDGDPAPLLNELVPDASRDLIDKEDLARYAITCADVPRVFNGTDAFPTPESLARGILNRIQNITRYFGGSPGTTDIDGGCQFWPVESIESFAGPWNKTLANPVVIVSSTVDPITPLSSAQLVHKLLRNSSRLITVNSPGHGVKFPSLCRTRATLAYFVNGTLPPNVLECQPEYGPFEEPEAKLASRSATDTLLIKSSEKVIAGLSAWQGFLR